MSVNAAPSVTTISPITQGMPAVLSFSRGEVGINTPLGAITTPVEATLTGPSLTDISALLVDMADPKAAHRSALDDARSWKSNGRQVQILRNVATDGSIVTAQVVATSPNEAIAILGALSNHTAVQLAR